jgi:guanylate kinase
VSLTTRGPRKGERNGVHYGFVTPARFDRLRRQGRLAEWAPVHDHIYGTPRANIERARRQRRVMLFNLDVQGAASLRREVPGSVTIFLEPPSRAVLRQRLLGRHSEDVAARRLRLRTAVSELARRGEYDYIVTNDRLPQCVRDCESIIRAELLRRAGGTA